MEPWWEKAIVFMKLFLNLKKLLDKDPKKVISRRKGDLDKYWADVTKAKKI